MSESVKQTLDSGGGIQLRLTAAHIDLINLITRTHHPLARLSAQVSSLCDCSEWSEVDLKVNNADVKQFKYN